MDNPYTSAYAPATLPSQQYQPTVQDISAQKQLQAQMMQQQQQSMQPAQQSNPMALAQALMKYQAKNAQPTDPNAPTSWDKVQDLWNSATAPTPYDIQGL